MDKFTYNGTVAKTYRYIPEGSLSAKTYHFFKEFTAPVSAYHYSNVDAFGAQALCWYATPLSADIKSEIMSALGDDYKYISSQVEYDLSKVPDKGWMSINSKYLVPA